MCGIYLWLCVYAVCQVKIIPYCQLMSVCCHRCGTHFIRESRLNSECVYALCFGLIECPALKTGAHTLTHFMTAKMENCSLRCNEEIQTHTRTLSHPYTIDRNDTTDLTKFFNGMTVAQMFLKWCNFSSSKLLFLTSSATTFKMNCASSRNN